MTTQELFDLTIGRLDHVLSLLVLASKRVELDEANRQTLKHHAEDMIAAGQAILGRLAGVEGTPQPAGEPKIGDCVRVLESAKCVNSHRPGVVGKLVLYTPHDVGSVYGVSGPGQGTGCSWAKRVEVIT
jgi:hypothetical protein